MAACGQQRGRSAAAAAAVTREKKVTTAKEIEKERARARKGENAAMCVFAGAEENLSYNEWARTAAADDGAKSTTHTAALGTG